MTDNQRLQSMNGGINYPSRGDLDNAGKVALARVVRVNNKNHTADVLLQWGTYIGQWEGEEEEAITCKRVESTIGWCDERNVAYGDVTPLREGEYVFVAYADSDKHRPVIIGAMPPIDYTHLNSPEKRAENEYIREEDERFTVSRFQEYSFTDGEGQFEKVKHTGHFIVGKKQKMSDHRENAFNYEDLTIKDKWKYKTIRMKKDQMDKEAIYFKPFNYLFVTQDRYDQNEPGVVFHRFFHDSEKGVTRFSKDTANTLFFIETDDGFRIIHHRDSNRRPKHQTEPGAYDHHTLRYSDKQFLRPKKDSGPPPDFQPIVEVTEFEFDKDGRITIRSQDKSDVSLISISPKGISLSSTGPIGIAEFNPSTPRRRDPENAWQREWIKPPETPGTGIQRE